MDSERTSTGSLVSVGPVGGSSLPTEQSVSCETGVTRCRVSVTSGKSSKRNWLVVRKRDNGRVGRGLIRLLVKKKKVRIAGEFRSQAVSCSGLRCHQILIPGQFQTA